MADTKKRTPAKTDKAPVAVPAELIEDGKLENNVPANSLDSLKARYDTAEENEEIRNDGFELAKKSGLIRKQRPESQIYGYFSGPVNPKDEIRTDVDSPLAQVFDSTRSDYDSNAVSFSDISLEQEKKDAEAKAEDAPAEVEKPKRKRTTKASAEAAVTEEKPKKARTTKKAAEEAVAEDKPKKTRTTKKATEEAATTEEKPKRTRTTKKVTEEAVTAEDKPKRTKTAKKATEQTDAVATESVEIEETKKLTELVGEIETEIPIETPAPVPVINNRYGFDTHTRVIYIDESAEDGIQRNSDEELSSLFDSNNSKKKRGLFSWLRKKK